MKLTTAVTLSNQQYAVNLTSDEWIFRQNEKLHLKQCFGRATSADSGLERQLPQKLESSRRRIQIDARIKAQGKRRASHLSQPEG